MHVFANNIDHQKQTCPTLPTQRIYWATNESDYMGWKVRGSNSGRRGDNFRTRPDIPRGSPSLLTRKYVIISGGAEARARRQPPTPIRANVKERAELCIIPHLYLHGRL